MGRDMSIFQIGESPYQYGAHSNLGTDIYAGVDTVFDMVNKIHTIVGEMPSFKRYFIHVGFPDN